MLKTHIIRKYIYYQWRADGDDINSELYEKSEDAIGVMRSRKSKIDKTMF